MSLIDKSIKLQFIKNDSESYLGAITQAIYSIAKTIFINSFIDNTDSTIYFNQEKKDGIKFSLNNSNMNLILTFIINGNIYDRGVLYDNSVNSIFHKDTIYYNVNTEKMNFAFSFKEGYLNYCIGYQKEIGFYLCGFFGGSGVHTQGFPEIFLSDYRFYKVGTDTTSSYNKWVTDSIFPFITLQQIPLLISQGNFNNLYELTGVYDDLKLNQYHIIQSNNKNYRILSMYDFGLQGAGAGEPVLAMEVTDD